LSCVYIVCCLIVVSVLFVCRLIVVPLPPGETHLQLIIIIL
jgi:hypothetical protein